MTSAQSPPRADKTPDGTQDPSLVTVLMQAVHGIVLVRGPAGSALLLATVIDRSAPAGVLATVAGNDTTLVILHPGAAADEVRRALRPRGAHRRSGPPATRARGARRCEADPAVITLDVVVRLRAIPRTRRACETDTCTTA